MMKLRYVLIVSLLCLIFGIFAVGQNANQAQDQAAKLISLDNANQPTQDAQKSLTEYVHGHMGASTTVFLGASYQRALASTNASPATTGQVYHDAQSACVSRTSAVNQASCVQSYVAAHSTQGATNLQPTQVSKALYTLTLAAPRWSPDLAGLLLLVGIVGLVAGCASWALRFWR